MTWAVGDRAKWIAPGVPAGATWNPPPPGYKPPTPAEQEHARKLRRTMHVVVLELGAQGFPTKVRADDGWEFDPSISPHHLVAGDSKLDEGWDGFHFKGCKRHGCKATRCAQRRAGGP